MLDRFRCVLFDFDGTLAPNLDLPDMRRRVIELTLARDVPEAVFKDRYIVEIIDAAEAYLARSDAPNARAYAEDAHKLIYDIEMGAARGTEVFESTRPVLTAAASAGCRTAVVTRNCAPAVALTFPDWADYVDVMLARDQVTSLKPEPGHFEEALHRCGAANDQAAIVSDGAMDMRTGREVGLTCIGVLTGSSDAARLFEAGAHVVLEDISGLLEAGSEI